MVQLACTLVFIIIKNVGKELSPQQCDQIIGTHLSGIKGVIIATQFNIPTQTIYNTINRYKKTNTPHLKLCPG